MDPVTHTLVGVGMGEAFFKRRLGPAAVVILAVASNIPDVDVVVHLTSNPAAVTLRRSFGHSIFAFPLWSLALSFLFSRKYRSIPWKAIFSLCLLGSAVHVFFDLVNSFGVRVLWPLSPYRPELAILFIVDLILLGILAAPFLVPRVDRTVACKVSMACVAAYVVFCFANRQLAGRVLARETAGMKPEFSYVFPEPLGPHRWKGVVRRGGVYSVYLIYSLSGRAELKQKVASDLGNPIIEKVRASPGGRRLEAFFKAPVWKLYHGPDGALSARVYDLRFKSLVIRRRGAFEYAFPILAGGGVGPLSWAPQYEKM